MSSTMRAEAQQSRCEIVTTTEVARTLVQLGTDGFAVVRSEVDPDLLAELQSEGDALCDRFSGGERSPDFWCYRTTQMSDLLYRVHRLEQQTDVPRAAELFSGPLLRELAESLIGPAQPTVCAMVVKSPGGAGVPWHRDRDNVPPTSAINLSVFLDRATPENGCFLAVPGSHLLPDGAAAEGVRTTGPVVHVPVGPGDILVHDVRLVHGSGDNSTEGARRSIVVEFDSTLTTEPAPEPADGWS